MFVTIINDCNDDNAMNRQSVRAASLFGCNVSTIGVSDFSTKGSGEIEAAGNIIDTLDACEGREGVVLVNVANRHGKGKKWPNGTPFGYFFYKKVLVVSTIDGYCLSLVKKLKLVDEIKVLDIPTIIDQKIVSGELDKTKRKLIVDSQFRSFEFVPRVAKWIQLSSNPLESSILPISEIEDIPDCIWHIDNFGNCVTTMIAGENNRKIESVKNYDRLKDVPSGEQGLVVGSSGIEDKRFLTLVIQGDSFSKAYDFKTGDLLFN